MSTNKSFSTETSERYSRALFEVVKADDELNKVETDIQNFTNFFNSNSEIKEFIQNPTHSITTQNKVVDLLAEKFGFSKNLKNFFFLLIEKKKNIFC